MTRGLSTLGLLLLGLLCACGSPAAPDPCPLPRPEDVAGTEWQPSRDAAGDTLYWVCTDGGVSLLP
jgi:hypothetical protein